MSPAFDETYEPRLWRCDECRRVLGVVMRDVNRIRRLWVFFKSRDDDCVPTNLELWSLPRGMFQSHGVDWCGGVECLICGARTPWNLSTEIRERMRKNEMEIKHASV